MLRSVATYGRLQKLCSVASVRVNSTAAATAVSDNGQSVASTAWASARPFDEIPGPKPLPLVGNIWRFLPFIGEYHGMNLCDMHLKLEKQFGKMSVLRGVPGKKPMLFLYDPEAAETVYRHDGIWPIREALLAFGYYRNVTRKDFFTSTGGVLATQGEEWGKYRSIVNQPMMQPKIARFYVGAIDKIADDFLERISGLRDANSELPADFINELYKWALESIAMIALDTRIGCLEPKLTSNSEAQKMIDSVQDLFDTLYIMEIYIPFWKVFSTPTWNRFKRSMDTITDVTMKHINKAMETMKTLPEGHEPSVLERILAKDPNPKSACVMAIDMMAAGIDTTSYAAAFLLYYLAINPEAQRKLHAEVDVVLPKTSKQPITAQNLSDLKYLKACLKESMRLTPVALANMRTTIKDMVIRGHQIPKGSDVIMAHMIMSNMAENFSNPDKFMPERWLKTEQAVCPADKKTHPFVYLPFGHGPRSCVGRRFAELEVDVLIAKIMQKYSVEWHHPKMEVKSRLVNMTASPLKFRMIERN